MTRGRSNRRGADAGRRWACAVLLLLLLLLGNGCGSGEETAAEGETPTWHIGMGKSLYQRGDYTGSVRMYEKAIGMDQECAEAYLQLGIIYDDNLKDKAQALSCYRRFLFLEPDSMMAEMVKEWCFEIEKDLPPSAATPPPPRARPTPRRAALRASTPLPPPPSVSPTARVARRKPSPSPTPSRARPALTPPPRAALPSRYTVKAGDTLARIAIVHYGDRNAWKTIFEANRDALKKPNDLKPGTVLTIPARSGGR